MSEIGSSTRTFDGLLLPICLVPQWFPAPPIFLVSQYILWTLGRTPWTRNRPPPGHYTHEKAYTLSWPEWGLLWLAVDCKVKVNVKVTWWHVTGDRRESSSTDKAIFSLGTRWMWVYYIRNQQDATLAVSFISHCKITLHVSDPFCVHHQEY